MILPNLFFFLVNVILISRLFLTFTDRPISKKILFTMSGIQLFGLLFIKFSGLVIVFALILVLINWSSYLREKKPNKVIETRLISLFFSLLILGIFLAPWTGFSFNPYINCIVDSLSPYIIYLNNYENYEGTKMLILLFGILLVINEANLIVRFVFKHLGYPSKTEPKEKSRELSNDASDRSSKVIQPDVVDPKGYNAGRVIGILERVLIYFFVINSQFAAIGFVLAAKSFARFKDLDNRPFAEYVLIGTLLSTLLAMLAAGLTISLLP